MDEPPLLVVPTFALFLPLMVLVAPSSVFFSHFTDAPAATLLSAAFVVAAWDALKVEARLDLTAPLVVPEVEALIASLASLSSTSKAGQPSMSRSERPSSNLEWGS
ncbi:hypothetical protein EAI_11576 [Harpegnathos saltator]|uniref:Uncharacterized protein n=1 Tax=Harpegnathos saltator TaxID=610380 RepID=E2BUH6_HARSA|nr:hypothetical protein EAI_11576 [Harpegnathos saltator]